MCQEEGFKFCWDTKNNGTFPLDLAFGQSLKMSGHQLVYPRFGPFDILIFENLPKIQNSLFFCGKV